MKPVHSDETPIDDILIDRLVEGELSDAERRELLLRLDSTPDGWKKCCRAFLEAQAWRQSFSEPVVELPAVAAAPGRRWAARTTWLAVAAVLLLTFGCGLLAGTQYRRPAAAAVSPDLVEQGPPMADGGVRALGQFVWPATLVQGIPSMQITVFEGSGFDEEWLRSQPPAVPELVAKQVERRGCRVHQEREVLPLRLADGRNVAVLVDRNAVQIVGRPVL